MKFFSISLAPPNTKMKEKSSSNIFPYEDILTKEMESWKSYSDCLRKQDRELFYEMLNSCYKYSSAITTKGKELSTTSVCLFCLSILSYLLKQNRK